MFAWLMYLLLSLTAGQVMAGVVGTSQHHSPAGSVPSLDKNPDCLTQAGADNPHVNTLPSDGCCHDVHQGKPFLSVSVYGPHLNTHGQESPIYISFLTSIHPSPLLRPPIQ